MKSAPDKVAKSGTSAQLVMADAQATMHSALTVRELVAENPRRAHVFERWGIPYCCCNGGATLDEACRERGAVESEVAAALRECDAVSAHPHQTVVFWEYAPLEELVRHIETEHRESVIETLARTSYLIDRVAEQHGEIYSELWELQALFEEFKAQAETHLERERGVLFPLLRHLDDAPSWPHFQGNLVEAVRTLRAEIQFLSDVLARMRAWTHEFTPPLTACNTYRVMLDALGQLEAELREDLLPEEELLFTRALALEKRT